MAAKPPKPPGSLINQNNEIEVANSNSDINDNNCNNIVGASINNNNNNNSNKNNQFLLTNSIEKEQQQQQLEESNKTNHCCNCTNISIMHLFHEMKQEFPTIPDTIVAQCVNENCHQRENCIQMLRNELELNPMPVQTFPAKVVHQQRHIAKPAKPLKPTRLAPNTPTSANSKSVAPTSLLSLNNQNCDSVELTKTNKKISQNSKDVTNSNPNTNHTTADEQSFSSAVGVGEHACDMPSSRALNIVDNKSCSSDNCESSENVEQNCVNNAIVGVGVAAVAAATSQMPLPIPRARPTTLSLNKTNQQTQEQQQRQQLNKQLQQHLEQRNRQKEQQQQQQQFPKPIRRAPLPPLPPKPSTNPNNQQSSTASSSSTIGSPTTAVNLQSPHSQQFHHNNSQQNNCCSNGSSCLTSPMSSCAESEISVNVSLSSPTTAAAAAAAAAVAAQPNNRQQLKSPIRHRSVITVQPEPPYMRDFVAGSPTTSTSVVSSNNNNNIGGITPQKSFTSVNLTLRQPNSATPQSTIDISAGPGLTGAGSGLTYSSVSYDARRGYQKNFHITVTDKGSGVFSASRIRPRSSYYPGEQDQQSTDTTGNGGVNPLRTTSSADNVLQTTAQQQQEHFFDTQLADKMCVPKESDAFTQIIERQKTRRDKLATALRDNKKRLSQVELEINVLTEPLVASVSERLDDEIQKLRCDCQAMLNELENARRVGLVNRQQQQPFIPTQLQQTQAFPRQTHWPMRAPASPAVTARRQMSTDLTQQQQQQQQQHNSNSSTPLLVSPNALLPPPPTYEQYCQLYQQHLLLQQQQQQQQQQSLSQQQTSLQTQTSLQQQPAFIPTDSEGEYSDSNTDGNDDDEEPLEMWACELCTFQNHPQLNICECCENVRIKPGTIRIVPSATVAATTSPASTNSLVAAVNNVRANMSTNTAMPTS